MKGLHESVTPIALERRRTPAAPARTLATAATGHDNNLNLLRVFAALMVLLSHCFVLVTGNPADEPGRDLVGLSLGDISVDVFFIVSGFLVTKSIARSRSLTAYALARGLRIYPGLWASLLLTAVVVSCCYSNLSPSEALLDGQTVHYIWKNALMVAGAFFWTGGSFPNNPYPSNVNASLWTLPLEIWMYLILAAGWWLSSKGPRIIRGRFNALIYTCALGFLVGAIVVGAVGHPSNSLRHAAMFFLGAAAFSSQGRIVFRHWMAACAALMLAAATVLPHLAFEVVYRLVLPYVVLYAAFIPGGVMRRYNALGDYSYGIYIYAFPVQQAVAASVPDIGVIEMFGLAGAITIALSVLSWHLIEQRSLAWRGRLETRLARPGT